MRRVLFLCVHNAGRSQMAEAFFNALAPPGLVALSAGTQPATDLNPAVVEIMSEVGIDLRGRSPNLLTPQMIESAERVISMGCGVAESCPVGITLAEDWDLDDPAGQQIEVVRRIRDEIKRRVEALLASLREPATGGG
jgi:protein-tyrosine-phosphatase